MTTIKVPESVFPVIVGLLCVTTSCRSPSNVETPASATQSATEYIAQAEQLYGQREDLNRLRQGIVMLRQAHTVDPGNYDAAWKLAKYNYYLATHTDSSDERDKAFRDGIEAGKAAVKLQDGKPDGHFWLGANYGLSAKASVLSGLSEFDDIKNEMETVLKLDEGYQNGSAYLGLGQLYLEAPGLLGGDTQKAIQYLEKGLKFGPDNALLRANLAAAYAEANRNEDARKQIDGLLAMKPVPGYEAEYRDA